MSLELIERHPSGQKTGKHPLLFVHGAWHGAWCWDEYFLPYFADQGYDVYALSLRGHGKSDGSIRGARISDYVRNVEEVAAKIGGDPILIGHSMGGFITQKVLEDHTPPAAVLLAPIPILRQRYSGI